MRDGSQFACMLFHPRIDGGIPLDSAVESQQFRSHRRSTFFEIFGYVTPYTRRPLACRARRNDGYFLSNAVAFTGGLVGNLDTIRPDRVLSRLERNPAADGSQLLPSRVWIRMRF